MRVTEGSLNLGEVGRASADLAGKLRESVVAGEFAVGEFVPSVRELSALHGVSRETARRALKSLEREGLVIARPGNGYQVRPRATDPAAGCPVAYVGLHAPTSDRQLSPRPFHTYLQTALREAAERRGWSLLNVATGGLTPAQVLEQLKSQRAFGLVLDTPSVELIGLVRRAGIPAVIVDSWNRESGLDAVMQDGQLGGLLAADYLVSKGCERIAWFGRADRGDHATDRLSGALAGLHNAGRSIPTDLLVEVDDDVPVVAARRLLSRKRRPDGVMALWHNYTLAIVTAARELGLTPGEGLHLVGWCADEARDELLAARMEGAPLPPLVGWSVRTMAELAAARLAERRESPDLPPVRVKVPVKLESEAKE
jgi:DNA-binding LacI/PurR family transcriptional regulator